MTEQLRPAVALADLPTRRMMLVHAHPDDECIGNGATMAKYVAEGAAVTLVTCTLGEEGEILVDDLLHLGADADDDLGQHRLGELKAAMGILGVTDFLLLGGEGRFRDSGMAYNEAGQAIARDTLRDGIFWTTDLLEAANELVPVIRDRRPQVLITYNEVGAYGHPDHVQAHRVAMYAAQLAGVTSYRPDLGEAWTIDRILWNTMSQQRLSEGIKALRAAGDTETFKGFDVDGGLMPMVSADHDIAAVIDGGAWITLKREAMLAHASQIRPDGPFFAGTEIVGEMMWGYEDYRFVSGVPFPGQGCADDLFAGLN